MKINLNEITDGLEGDWWHHIKTKSFYFVYKVDNPNNLEVEPNDILIHKEFKIKNGKKERFPTVKYHVIKKTGPQLSSNQGVKNILGKSLVRYAKKTSTLFPNCEVKNFYKNGAVQIDYIPTKFDKFSLKIDSKEEGIEDPRSFFTGLSKAYTTAPTGKTKQEWTIASSSDPKKKYRVTVDEKGEWKCTCPHFTFRKQECKHIKECKNKI